jgi:hypothetical protein
MTLSPTWDMPRVRRHSYKGWAYRKLSDISLSQVFYSCACAQPRCQAALLVSSFGLPARPASTPRSWSSISSSVSSWAPKGTLSSIRSSSGSFVGFLFALSMANFFYLVAIVAAAAVLHHGRVAGRNLCDAISGLLAAQRSTPSPQLSRKTLARSIPSSQSEMFSRSQRASSSWRWMEIGGFYVSCLPPSSSARTSGRLQIQQIFASGGVEGLAFRIPGPDRSDPSGPYGRKILVASIAKPLSSLYRAEVASVVSASHPLRRMCTLGISCDGSSSAD